MKQNIHIIIQNIYYMLSYAFRALRQKEFKDIVAEKDFDNAQNLFAAILSKGIASQLKQGLYKEYINRCEDRTVLRGKIDMAGTMRNKIANKQMLFCEYDELSENNLYNQILKTTVMLLLQNDKVDLKYKNILKKEMLFFSNIDEVDPPLIPWNSIRFHRNNLTYQMLIGLCQLILESMLITEESGTHKLASFEDNQGMCYLYQRFVWEFYRQEFPEIDISSPHISWAVDNGDKIMLPTMESDIVLSFDDTVLIIDTKYYGRSMQKHYDSYTQHSNNMYQIFAYVKNKALEPSDRPIKVSGMILYAKTDEEIQPDHPYFLSGNRIDVRTLDLNCEFIDIQKSLRDIVKEFFPQYYQVVPYRS